MTLAMSIVTPTLNAAAFLPRCLESVRVQGYDELQHIVVDGGSTDGTLDIARSAEGVLLLERPRSNQSNAINAGFRVASGEVLAWLNADDEYALDAARFVTSCFETNPELDVIYGDCDVIDIHGRRLWREQPGPYDFKRLLRRGNYLAQPAVFVRRRVFERSGYLDESFECGMDYELWLRIAGYRIAYVPRVLAAFRWHPTSKTAGGQFVCWRELLRAVRRYGGGWTPELAWSFSRMLMTVARQRMHQVLIGAGVHRTSRHAPLHS